MAEKDGKEKPVDEENAEVGRGTEREGEVCRSCRMNVVK
jgi:hypothetical protein